ncbi:flagellar protein FlgN [Maribrevibacterium harenarium]|uniref:Flagellar protein FlgN n=1 Tax=Maribrevibacterium harenarium TaxID=2589817 RepID=A0A501X359_9GAMM|nr:flagellar protein FlgN [Maribrevibacterium harenarium]TPE54935.1 flagellar protein FlgN [Maribrevibacterium harenarium]
MIPLAPIFQDIRDELSRLAELLTKERLELAQASPQQVLDTAGRKKEILDNIDKLNAKRIKMLVKFGILDAKKPSDAKFKAWLAQQDNLDDVKALIKECDELLEVCKKDNNTNMLILGTVQRRTQTMLEMMQGHSRKNRIYTPSGGTKPVSSKHTLGRA